MSEGQTSSAAGGEPERPGLTGHPTPPSHPARPAPALAWDGRRNGVSLAIAAVTTAASVTAYGFAVPLRFTLNTVAVVAFVFWVSYAVTHVLLTQRAFGSVDAETLRAWLRATTPRRRAERLAAHRDAGGPTVNAQWSILAFLAVALVILLPGLITSIIANLLGFAVVASAWVVTITAYAVHYARLDAATPSLDFPGGAATPGYMDYFYLSAQISTTFSSSDVSILTTQARRVVTGQTIIAFVFSTFIIAMLISVLFAG